MGILDFTIKRALPAAAATTITAWAGITTANDDWDDYFGKNTPFSLKREEFTGDITMLGVGALPLSQSFSR